MRKATYVASFLSSSDGSVLLSGISCDGAAAHAGPFVNKHQLRPVAPSTASAGFEYQRFLGTPSQSLVDERVEAGCGDEDAIGAIGH